MRLHLGAGKKHWDGWINVDAFRGLGTAEIVADVRAIPLDSGIAAQVVAIHLLEHFYRWEADALLAEWMRLLRPGGTMIIEVPCMDKVYSYIRSLPEGSCMVNAQLTTWALWGDPKYEDPSMMHRWGYGTHELITLMQQAGLDDVHQEPTRYHLAKRDMRMVGRKP